MHSQHRDARLIGLMRRQVALLEAIAEAEGVDTDDVDQCPCCGEWFKSVPAHRQHCDA